MSTAGELELVAKVVALEPSSQELLELATDDELETTVGVPVAAVEFEAIGELVKDGKNGLLFRADPGSENAASEDNKGRELGEILVRLFSGSDRELAELKKGAMAEASR